MSIQIPNGVRSSSGAAGRCHSVETYAHQPIDMSAIFRNMSSNRVSSGGAPFGVRETRDYDKANALVTIGRKVI